MLEVFVGEDGLVGGDEPVDTEALVHDADAVFCLGMVELIALVLENGGLAQHGKTVGKTSRHEELAVVLFRQLYGDMLPEGGRALADVNGYIEHGTLDAAHKLALGKGRALEVETPQDTVGGHGLVVLHKVYLTHLLVKLPLREALKEIAARITYHPRFDDDYAFD